MADSTERVEGAGHAAGAGHAGHAEGAGHALAYEYTTFPRQFVSYRWFKPLLVALLTVVFVVVFEVILMLTASIWAGDLNFIDTLGSSYDDMDVYTGPGALAELGSIAIMLASLALAALIVRDRPFSSYSSSRGGWSWGAFLKCLGVAVVLMGVLTVIEMAFFPEDGADGIFRFTPEGIVACIILIPLQCVAEEYVFRGLIMQTVGAWTKLPAIAIVVQAVAFAAGHPYNVIGVVAIFANGIVWGIVAWQTRGLEATSAMHIVNNMLAFFLTGAGLSVSTSQVDIVSLVIDLATVVAYAAIVIPVGKKRGWFAPKADGAAAFNAKKLAKM